MERIAIVSILAAPVSPPYGGKSELRMRYMKICRVSENLRVLDDSGGCKFMQPKIAVGSQAQEYQIGCRDSENEGTIIVTAPST